MMSFQAQVHKPETGSRDEAGDAQNLGDDNCIQRRSSARYGFIGRQKINNGKRREARREQKVASA